MRDEIRARLEWIFGQIAENAEESLYMSEIEDGDDLIFEYKDIRISMYGYARKAKIKRLK